MLLRFGQATERGRSAWQYREAPARPPPPSSATVTRIRRRPRLRVTARALRRFPGVTSALTPTPSAHGIANSRARPRRMIARRRRPLRASQAVAGAGARVAACSASSSPRHAVRYPAVAAAVKRARLASSFGKAKCLTSRPMRRSISAFDRINSSLACAAGSRVSIR